MLVQSQLVGLDVIYNASPYAEFTKPGVDTFGLDIIYNATPLLMPSAGEAPPPALYNATQFFAVFY